MLRLLCGLLLCLLPFTNQASNKIYLNIYTESLPPFQFKTETGEIDGVNITILKNLLTSSGVDYSLEIYPWSRAYRTALNNDNGALISTARTKYREPLFHWVGPFLSTSTGVYLYSLAKHDIGTIKQVEELSKYSIGTVRDDVFGNKLLIWGVPEENIISFADNDTAHQMLFSGKVDLVIASQNTILDSASKYGYTSVDVVKNYYIPASSGNYLAINKAVPKELVKILNNKLVEIQKDTDLARLQTKYKVQKKLHWR